MKKTFILRWNPEISSWNKANFEIDYGFGFYDSSLDFPVYMNWSIYEWDKLEVGDEFYMFTTGDDNQSKLVLHGQFISPSYCDDNWREGSYKRIIHYADFYTLSAFHPDSDCSIPVSSLRDVIPDYDFGHGHAGMVLDVDTAAKLRDKLSEHRLKLIEKRKERGLYTPRTISETLSIPEASDRIYINDSRFKLVEGFKTDCSDGWNTFKAAIALNVDKAWDTFWTIAENAFSDRRFIFVVHVHEFIPLIAECNSIEEAKKKIEKYRSLFERDSYLGMECCDSRGRRVLLSYENEILLNYGRKTDLLKFIRSLGFEERKDIYLFFEENSANNYRNSIYGREFSNEMYCELKEAFES